MTTASVGFHFRHAIFNIREQFSDLVGGIAGYLLFPFFIWILSRVWLRFNSYQGNLSYPEILLYVGVGEALFMTFLRQASFGRASADFSLSLARPRSWLAMSFSGIFGRMVGGRLIFLLILMITLPLLGSPMEQTLLGVGRFLLLLPILTIAGTLWSLLFASAQVFWEQTTYFVFPISKLFLALGGVMGPLVDFSEPARSYLIRSPSSDLFFQAAWFCVRGEFHGMSGAEWFIRVLIQIGVLMAVNLWFFRLARRHHQSYGG